jgi:hypothetical protein
MRLKIIYGMSETIAYGKYGMVNTFAAYSSKLPQMCLLGNGEVTNGFLRINRVFINYIIYILHIQNFMLSSFLVIVLECLVKEHEKHSEKLARYLTQ